MASMQSFYLPLAGALQAFCVAVTMANGIDALNMFLCAVSGRCDTGWRPRWVVRDRIYIVQE
jgi:hypothetical protein